MGFRTVFHSTPRTGIGCSSIISALDIANFIEHEEFHTNDSFNGRVRITQEGLNLLEKIVK